MEYNTYSPSEEAEAFIKCFWTLKVPKDFPKQKQQVLPDGCYDLIFTLADDIKRYTDGDDFILQPRSFVLGQITKPFFVEPLGEVDTFAVRFFPNTFSHFVKMPLSELANRETPLTDLFEQSEVLRLEQSIRSAKTVERRIYLVQTFLMNILQHQVDVDNLLNQTIDLIFQTKGTMGVNKLLEGQLNKRRQLERMFSNQIGISPKQLCRIIRLQANLQCLLDTESDSLTRIGYEQDYYDQAHFIKDFKDFTGVSPKEFYTGEQFLLSSKLYSTEEG